MKTTCTTCYKPKAKFTCGVCACSLCKSCVHFVNEDDFSFLKTLPEALSHNTYCGPCYDAKVTPELESYNALIVRARNVAVFFKDQGKETSRMRRIEKPVKVKDCRDRNETVLRLAFFAAQSNFNAIIDVDVVSKHINNKGYQSSIWNGSGIPIQLNDRQKAGYDFTGG